MAFFLVGLVIALAICLLFFVWDRARWRHGRMLRARRGGSHGA